uniref:Uncharacterized protein n=1 Tax=Anguilla anguilla TaxID=7936 RepID=A0A0E9XDX2_ANGAN
MILHQRKCAFHHTKAIVVICACPNIVKHSNIDPCNIHVTTLYHCYYHGQAQQDTTFFSFMVLGSIGLCV